MGHSPSLLAELRAIDAEIVRIDESFTVLNHPQDTSATVQELQEFFREKAQDLRSVAYRRGRGAMCIGEVC
jgi:hypothetical protein